MKSEIVIHGIPQGHNTWGTDDPKYYEGFYNGIDAFSKTKKLYVVEVLRNGDSFSAYYSLIRAYQVAALNGRQGSYFGMTFRIDGEYCTDVHSLFNLLEQVYNQMIVGHVVESVGDGLKYKIAQFSDLDKLLSDVKQVLEKNIASYFSNRFEKFDDSFTKDQATVFQYYNIDDVDSESFLNSTRRFGKILISPEYPSKDSRLSAYDNKLASLAKELEAERESNKRSEETAVALKKKVISLESQLEASKSAADVKAVANRFERPMSELLDLLRKVQGTAPGNSRDNEQMRKQIDSLHRKLSQLQFRFYIAAGVAAVLLILSCLFGIKAFTAKPYSASNSNTVPLETYNKLQEQFNELKSQQAPQSASMLTSVLQDYWKNDSKSRINVKPDPAKDESGHNVYLTNGLEYTLSLSGLPKDIFENKGNWIFDGLEAVKAESPNVVKATIDSGDASAKYVVDGIVVVKRDFIVK